jgi:hypothetical protein
VPTSRSASQLDGINKFFGFVEEVGKELKIIFFFWQNFLDWGEFNDCQYLIPMVMIKHNYLSMGKKFKDLWIVNHFIGSMDFFDSWFSWGASVVGVFQLLPQLRVEVEATIKSIAPMDVVSSVWQVLAVYPLCMRT